MNRRTAKRVYDAKLACEEIISFAEGQTWESFRGSRSLQLIIERLLITVGEAINIALREDEDDIIIPAASEIIGLRNRMVHGYDKIRLDVVWSTTIKDVPVLLAHLDELLEQPIDRS